MQVRLLDRYRAVFECSDAATLERVQDICDGEKVRMEPRTIFPVLSLPKIARIFPRGWEAMCDVAAKQAILQISDTIKARRLKIEQIRQDYRAAAPMKFDYEPQGRYKPLRHQIAMARCLSETTKCGLLADPGTCKTSAYLWGLDILRQQGKIKRALVITLSHLKENVLEEMSVAATNMTGVVMDGRAHADKIINKKYKQAKRNKDYDIYLANYESMSGIVDIIPEGFFDAVVVDEGHRIGAPTTDQTKAIVGCFENTPYKYVVTGTLVSNNEISFFMPFRFMGPDTVPEADFFCFRSKHFYTVDPDQRIWVAEGVTKDLVREQITKNAICFRKEDCLDLPGIVYSRIPYDLRGDQAAAYRQVKQELIYTIQKGCCDCKVKTDQVEDDGTPTACLACPNTLLIKNALVSAGKLAQICCGFFTETKTEFDENGVARNANVIHFMQENPKLDLVIAQLNNIPADEKVIIWSNFTSGIKLLCDRIGVAFGNDSYIAVYGDADAYVCTNRFKNEPGIRFAVMNPAKAGTGLNLQFGHYQFFFMNDYSMIKREQALARQDREGQKEKVLVTDFCGRIDGAKAVDWNILDILMSKKQLSQLLTDMAKAIGLTDKEWGPHCNPIAYEIKEKEIKYDPNDPPPWDV